MSIRFNKIPLKGERLSEAFTVSVNGSREVSVTGSKRVIEYADEKVRLETSECIVSVSGSSLSLKAYNENEMRISGKISGVAIEKGKV